MAKIWILIGILMLIFEFSGKAQSKSNGDTIKIFLYSEKALQQEMDRLYKQTDSIESIIKFYRNIYYSRNTIYNLKIK